MKVTFRLVLVLTGLLLSGCIKSATPAALPEAMRLYSVADTYVRGGDSNADINFSESNVLAVKLDRPNSHASLNRISFVRFDIEELDSPVTNVMLRLYSSRSPTEVDVDIRVVGVTNEWAEDGITWSNAPLTGGITVGNSEVPEQGEWFEIDVTEYVNDQVGAKNVSFRIESVTDHEKGDVRFSSSREDESSLHPHLYVII